MATAICRRCPTTGQWVNFLRHHDELNIGRLTKDQRDEIFAAFGARPRTCSSTIAASAVGWLPCWAATARLRLAYSLLFSLPGTPLICYGEEIGMGENLELPERYGRSHADAVDALR